MMASSICSSPAMARQFSITIKATGRLTDVTAKAGIQVEGWSISSAWLDYDRDGCVDLFVGRYVKFDPSTAITTPPTTIPDRSTMRRIPTPFPQQLQRHIHRRERQVAAYKGRAMGVTAADYDGDGYPDIYVANDKTENFLFHNKRDGTFEEVAGDLGVAYGQNGESTSAMGPVLADSMAMGGSISG